MLIFRTPLNKFTIRIKFNMNEYDLIFHTFCLDRFVVADEGEVLITIRLIREII